MPGLNNSAQQRHILVIGFTLLFSVSLAVILFEHVQKQETASQPGSNNFLAVNEVLGDEIIRDESIALYHSQVRQVATLLFKNIDQLSQGQAINKNELAAANQTITTIKVPGIYQKLHFKLLRILNKFEAAAPADLDYLVEQRGLLQEEFSWL